MFKIYFHILKYKMWSFKVMFLIFLLLLFFHKKVFFYFFVFTFQPMFSLLSLFQVFPPPSFSPIYSSFSGSLRKVGLLGYQLAMAYQISKAPLSYYSWMRQSGRRKGFQKQTAESVRALAPTVRIPIDEWSQFLEFHLITLFLRKKMCFTLFLFIR